MRIVYQTDEQGYYDGPVVLQDGEPLPKYCTEKEPPDNLWRKRLVNYEWIDEATPEEIAEWTRVPERQPSEVELLQRENALLFIQIAEVTAQLAQASPSLQLQRDATISAIMVEPAELPEQADETQPTGIRSRVSNLLQRYGILRSTDE